jgi:hypothetical protein
VDAQLIGQGSGLQNGANLFLERVAAFFRIEAANPRDTAVGSPQSLQDFNRGSFPGSIGPEQAKYFAFLYRKADPTDCLHRAVAFVETFDLDDWFAHAANPFVWGERYFYHNRDGSANQRVSRLRFVPMEDLRLRWAEPFFVGDHAHFSMSTRRPRITTPSD